MTMNNNTEDTSSPIFLIPVIWDWRHIIQLILAIVGIIGNAMVIHVYRRTREMKQNTTNTFIAALAAADLVTSISIIPHPVLSRVPQNGIGSFYCKMVWSSNIMWISIVSSVISLTMLAVERYVAVAYPIHYKRVFTTTKTRLMILGIWLFASTLNTFGYYETFAVNGQCVHILPSLKFQMFLGCAIFIVEYLVPMIIMLATNIRTIQILNRQARSFSSGADTKRGPSYKLIEARRRVVNMLFIVIITFIVCWSPDQFAFLAFNLGWVPFEYAFGPLYRAFVALAFANSCVNPIIYTLMNRNFREAIAKQLPSIKCSSIVPTKTGAEASNTLFETPIGEEVGHVNGAQVGVVNTAGPSDTEKATESTLCTKSTTLEQSM